MCSFQAPVIVHVFDPMLCCMQALEEEGDVYARLARSIAPEIWGHEDVKKVPARCTHAALCEHLLPCR